MLFLIFATSCRGSVAPFLKYLVYFFRPKNKRLHLCLLLLVKPQKLIKPVLLSTFGPPHLSAANVLLP